LCKCTSGRKIRSAKWGEKRLNATFQITIEFERPLSLALNDSIGAILTVLTRRLLKGDGQDEE
jgi:hypothetical protein